jgi:hypothetical protein
MPKRFELASQSISRKTWYINIKSVSENQASHWIHANLNFVRKKTKKRIKWKGKSIRGVQCQVLAAYRKGYYCTPSQPIAENVGTSMNEDDRSHKLGDFFFLFFFFTLQAPPTHTHNLCRQHMDSLREWLHYPSNVQRQQPVLQVRQQRCFQCAARLHKSSWRFLNIY